MVHITLHLRWNDDLHLSERTLFSTFILFQMILGCPGSAGSEWHCWSSGWVLHHFFKFVPLMAITIVGILTVILCTLYKLVDVYICTLRPNSHGLKAITKLTASGWKKPILPHPPPPKKKYSTVGGGGGGGAFSTALKICLIKAWVTLKLSSAAH
jgi:hypothetical protein